MSKRIIIREALDHTLPIGDAMDWATFQSFCTDLLSLDPRFSEARDYLKQGNKQDGIDVYAIPFGDEKLTVVQCKLKKYISSDELAEIVDTFLKGDFVDETKEFILCTNYEFKTQKAEQAIKAERKKLKSRGITFNVWDKSGLEKRLRTCPQPELVRRYFGEEIAFAFYGDIFKDWVKQYRRVQKRSYPSQSDYIERTLTPHGELLREEELLFGGLKNRQTLSELFTLNSDKEGRKMVLTSIAGFGKTWELKQLVSHFSNEKELLFPILNYLQDYEEQSINELLRLHEVDWDYVPKDALLLVFDGLDEITGSHFQTFIKHLNQFAEANPKAHIVISSRANFYDIAYPPLRGFETYFLNDFTQQDVADYLAKTLPNQSVSFYQKVQKSDLEEQAKHPYYLSRLVRFYKDTSTPFPNNKSELFNRILFERFERDKQKYGLDIPKIDFINCAEKIAFCLTLTGKSNLNEETLEDLIPEKTLRDNFKRFFLLTPDDSAVKNLSFEHKNLQEFLCAAVLQRIPFSDVKSLLTFEHAPELLQPQFLNTVSFLFETADSALFEQLLSWLQESQPEILVRFEKDRISREIRVEILKSILSYYRSRDLPLHVSQHFSFEDLASFVDLDSELIDYFEQAILKEETSDWFVYDIVHLLSTYKKTFVFRKRITDIVLGILNKHGSFGRLGASCIDALSKLSFFSKEIVDAIFSSTIDLLDFDIRSSIVRYLEGAKFTEEYADFFLESIDIYEKGQREVVQYGVNDKLERIVTSFEKAENIKSVLQTIIKKPELISQHSSQHAIRFNGTTVAQLLQNAQKAYNTDPSIAEDVYQILISDSSLEHDSEYASAFKKFLVETFGSLVVFKRIYQEKAYNRDLMMFASQEGCDFLLKEYRAGKISEGDMKVLRNRLSWADRILFRTFQDTLVAEFGEAFAIDETPYDYNKIWSDNALKNQQMLIDQQLFFQEAALYAEAIGKERFIDDDLWDHENIKLIPFQRSMVADCVIRYSRKTERSVEEALQYLRDDKNWEWFKIKRIKEILSESKERDTIDKGLVSFAENWCKERMRELNYENAVIQSEQGSCTIDSLVNFNNELYRLLRMDVEDELLLKILLSDITGGVNKGELGMAGLIATKVQDKALLKRTILGNLKKNLPAYILQSHLALCHHMQYEECLPILYDTIVEDKTKDTYYKKNLLEYYLDLGGSLDDFRDLLPSKVPKEMYQVSWEWHLLAKLKDCQPSVVEACMLDVLKDSEQPRDNKIQACRLLIQMDKIEGLVHWKEYIISHKQLLFDHYQEFILKHVLNMPTETVVSLVSDVMIFTYSNNLHETQRISYSIEHAAHSILRVVGASSVQSFELVTNALTEISSKFSEPSIIRSIEFYKEKIAQDFYKQNEQTYSLEEALKCYNSLSLEK